MTNTAPWLLVSAVNELRYVLGAALTSNSYLSEVVDDYSADARSGDLSPQRLLGFAQGLCAAGVLDIDGFDDVSVAVCKAAGLGVYL